MLKGRQDKNKLCKVKMAPNGEQEQFHDMLVRLNAIACSFHKGEDFDMAQAENESGLSINALKAESGLQEMLAAQLLSIHQLQQKANAMAAKYMSDDRYGPYFLNTSAKLANTFVQQANLLSKLQGGNQQRIVVERVDVHEGGQAVVGNVNSQPLGQKEKK